VSIMKHIAILTGALIAAFGEIDASSSRAQSTSTSHPSSTATNGKPGDFVWHDLVTDDPAACRTFYEALFGWTFESADGVDPGYTIIRNQGRPIGGIVRRRGAQPGAGQWLSYVIVMDVNRTAAAFEDAGGRVIRGPLDARKDLRIAAVADAQGAVVGLASRGPRFATHAASGRHEWLWVEYIAQDPESALDFYADVIGYRYEIAARRENFIYYVLSTDRPRAGLFHTLWQGEQSAWLPYIRVDDPAEMAERVLKLGGTVVIPPQPRVRNNSMTLVLDPSGAAVALQKFPFDNGETE
jgi:uncharacterized protein